MARPNVANFTRIAKVQSARAATLSQRILGLDWGEHLPLRIDDVWVESASFEEALPFIEAHYGRIFGDQQARFLADPMTPAKRRFCDEMDVLTLRADGLAERASGDLIGLLIGHPLDWSSYYMRSVAILPAYRKRHLLTRLVAWTEAPLRAAGVERIEGDCSPANAPMMKMLVGLGYLATGTTSSERWGAMVHFAKFLRDEAEEVFTRQFCGMRVSVAETFGGNNRPKSERRSS